jgi:hypothetical protein
LRFGGENMKIKGRSRKMRNYGEIALRVVVHDIRIQNNQPKTYIFIQKNNTTSFSDTMI